MDIEEYYYKFMVRKKNMILRLDIYRFLSINKELYKDIPFELDGKIINSF